MKLSEMRPSRREFLALAAVAANASASPLGMPIGLQPYTVREYMQKDFEGTLRKVKEMGYGAVEVSENFYGHTPAQTRGVFKSLGLRTGSGFADYPKDDAAWAKSIEYAHTLELKYMITTLPGEWRNSLDGWKRGAERFNQLGEKTQKAGVTLAYHNHNWEYREFDGKVAYDEFLRLTDPKLVVMEMDCFWTRFAGKDPISYLQKYPGRFPLLHVKDLKSGWAPALDSPKGVPFTPIGTGVIDYKAIFRAAKKAGLKHYFVEQDRWDEDALEAARKSAAYLKKLKV